MNVTKWILAAFASGAVLTGAAVAFVPEMEFIQYVVPVIQAGAISTLVLTVIALYKEGDMTETQKKLIMSGFLVAILTPTIFGAAAFIHESETSWTNGEIHYHADYEVLVDTNGTLTRTNLVNPQEFCKTTEHESSYMCKLNDRTGAVSYHEHNDQRIHLEGVFKDREDASLAAFFETFGGELSNSRMVYPTTEGVIDVTNSGEKTIKILVQKGDREARHWCGVGRNVPEGERCESYGERADAPSEYIVSDHTQNPADRVVLDNIFIVYDNATFEEAIQDMRADGQYQGFGLKKSGEGYE